jgi:hypothetical protein
METLFRIGMVILPLIMAVGKGQRPHGIIPGATLILR